MTQMNAVIATAVSYAYGSKKALRGISLEIKSGEMYCFLGPNGGGKSTFLKLLSTLDSVHGGELIVFGKALPRDLRSLRGRIGVVFQSPALDKKLTVIENIIHHGQLYGISPKVLVRRAEDLLNFFGLSGLRDEETEKLSGGFKRRVEIAKCLVNEPQLLIMDEPTAGLDPIVRKQLWADLRRRQQMNGITIVFTTHFLDEADTSDTVALIHEGLLVAKGTPKELKAQVGSDILTIFCQDPNSLSKQIETLIGIKPNVLDRQIRVQEAVSASAVAQILERFRSQIEVLSVAQASLEDVFFQKTGQPFELRSFTQ